MWQYQQPASSQLQTPTSSTRISKYNWYRVFAGILRVTTGAILSFSFFVVSWSSLSFKNQQKTGHVLFLLRVISHARRFIANMDFDIHRKKTKASLTGIHFSSEIFKENIKQNNDARNTVSWPENFLGPPDTTRFFQFRHWSLCISPKAKLRGPFLRPSPVFFRPLSQHFSFLLWPHESARRFNRPFGLTRRTNHWKNTAFRDFSNIWRGRVFFLLTFALLHLLPSVLTACLICFSTLHTVGGLRFKLPSIIIPYLTLRLMPSWSLLVLK